MDRDNPIWWHLFGDDWDKWSQPKKARPKPGPYPGLPDLNPREKQRINSDSPLFQKVWFLEKCFRLSNGNRDA